MRKRNTIGKRARTGRAIGAAAACRALALALCLLLPGLFAAGDAARPGDGALIEDEAFMGSAGLREITLPAGLLRIGDRAFADCPDLVSMRCLSDGVQMGEGVFEGSPVAVVYCRPGSTVEAYALECGYEVRLAGSFTLACGAGSRGAAGIPLTWRVEDKAPALMSEGVTYTYTVLRGGDRVAGPFVTREDAFTYTPDRAGSYVLRADVSVGDKSDTAQSGTVQVGESIDGTVAELVTLYACYGARAEERIERALDEIGYAAPAEAEKWREIVGIWRYLDEEAEIEPGAPAFFAGAPEGRLCVAVMGYRLLAGGGLAEDAVARLRAALDCAEMWPDALILCTGGHSASANGGVSEAGQMKQWLVRHGVDESRIVTEERALTTPQNARFSWDAIAQRSDIAGVLVVTSDFHTRRALLDFAAERILRGESGRDLPTVVGYAACRGSSNSADRIDQAGNLLELAGYAQAAEKLYRGQFRPPKL